MTLEAIVRDMRPRAHTSPVYVVTWSGEMERAGACPSLLDLGRGPTEQNYYGDSQLAHAATYGMRARSGMLTL